jgi:membrane protease YdiL (CAAX protease family)
MRLPWLLRRVGLGWLACYGVVFAYNAIVTAFDIDILEPGEQLPEGALDHDWVLPILFVSIVIAAPIAEELFFRGFMFAGLRRQLPFLAAAAISGLVFASAHAQSGLIIPFTIVGIVLANTYRSAGVIYAAMGVHFLFNLFSFSLLVATR